MIYKVKRTLLIVFLGLICISCEHDSSVSPEPDIQENKTIIIVPVNSIETSVFDSDFNIKIQQNTNYDIEISNNWIHQVTSRSLTTEYLKFKVDFNTTQKERKGEIIFVKKDDGKKQTVEVRQRGGLWITCSIDETADKKSWVATDTIGVYSTTFRNVPFVYCDERQQFVTDHDGNIENGCTAYYPYSSISNTEIIDDDITDYLVADASFQFEPVAYPITVTVTNNNTKESKCRLVSDMKIFGTWKLTDGKIEATSKVIEKNIISGGCSIAVLAKAKENIAVIIENGKGNFTAENYSIDATKAISITHRSGTDYEALDIEKNANCYIIDKEGSYCFALRDAAGNQRWIDGNCSAEVIWSDFAKDFINNPKIVGDMVFFDAQMSSDKQGNAGLALKDSQGNILWSWHLWLTDQTDFRTVEKGKLLNIPLGSITNSRNFQYGDHYYALIYQYGRKDPFPNQSPESEFLAITEEGLNAYDNMGGFGTFYRRDWHQGIFDESCPMIVAESDNGKFGYSNVQPENIKWDVIDWDEVNNPCPPGFSLPTGNVVWKYMTGKEGGYTSFPGLKVKDLTAVEIYNNGLLNKNENYWFPAVKDRTPLYDAIMAYHPFCTGPSKSLYVWIKRTYINAGGYTYANSVSWTPDDMYGIEIDGWAWGYYRPLVCIKD